MNNKGFTLVEVIVASVVGAIVLLGIITYGMVGIKNFHSSRSETTAQNETEIVIMSMKNRLKSAKDYRVLSFDDLRMLEILYSDDSVDGCHTYDCAFVYSMVNTDMYIINNGISDEMSMDIRSLDIESLKKSGLVSKYITDFQVSPNKKSDCEDKVINIQVESTVGNQKYTQEAMVRIRTEI